MKQTRLIMGMPINLEIVDKSARQKDFDDVFDYFIYVDETFSAYKDSSEVSKINRGEINKVDFSSEMKTVLNLASKAKRETDGYFDVYHNGKLDPSGVVKGWAILNATTILDNKDFQNYYIDAGGDIQVKGKNKQGKEWRVGIRNPFNKNEIVKSVVLKDGAIATSGTYIRGAHIYNPKKKGESIDEVVSLSVVGKSILEADLLATAAFAMGKKGIVFIERQPGFEGYQIDKNGIATLTSGFKDYLAS